MNPTLALAAGLLLCATADTQAQSTDGFHGSQVVPVAVDSASFAQRFDFTTPNGFPVTVRVRYLPGVGTDQAAAGALDCLDVVVPAGGSISVSGLRTLCPGLVSGSAFGYLSLQAADSSDGMYSDIPVFAVYSRVSNPQGNGFSVEAFASHVFTSATTVASGLRRLAATGTSPAFQSNCFVGRMPVTGGSATPVRVNYRLRHGASTWAGYVDVAPGRLVRLLDVFAAAGAPAGDYDGAWFEIDPANSAGFNGILGFCTVQDNSSFGADFRIAKTSLGSLGMASQDGMAAREVFQGADVEDRAFEIGPGSSSNVHVVYFRHPDTVQCQLLHPSTLLPLTGSAGLEMRLYDAMGLEVYGGNNKTSTGLIHLGDKTSYLGYNNRYLIEVESNETNEAAKRPYVLYCASGSGNSFGYDLIHYQQAEDRF